MEITKRGLDAKKIEKIADFLKTIGHPLRLQILELLEQEEPLTVTDIQNKIEIKAEQSLLSHHLIKLKDKGILESEKKGMFTYYRLADRSVLKVFDCMDNCELF